jgi:cytochrome P450
MRSSSPVFLPQFDLWMVFDFDGVKRALVDHDAFSSDLSHAPGNGRWLPRRQILRSQVQRECWMGRLICPASEDGR